MQIKITITEQDLKKMILERMRATLGDVPLDESALRIEVKSKQNFRSEWETAAFRAIYDKV